MNSSCTSYFYCSSWFCQSWMQFPEVPLLRSVLVEPQPQNFSPSWFHKRLFLRCVPTQLSCIRTRFWCCACTWCASVQACCITEGREGKVKDHACKKAWVVPPPFMQKFSLRVVTDSAFGWLLFKCKNTLFFFFLTLTPQAQERFVVECSASHSQMLARSITNPWQCITAVL